jgi:hypothetical protein
MTVPVRVLRGRKRSPAAARLAPTRSEGTADPAPPKAIAMLLKQLGHIVDTPLRLKLR